MTPIYIEVFASVIANSQVAQVGTVTVLLLILMDVLFGTGAAIVQHRFSSEKMRKGIGHKAAELGFLVLGIIADGALLGGFDFGISAMCYVAICAYLAVMELGSVMETLALLNPQLASSPLFKMLDEIHAKENPNG